MKRYGAAKTPEKPETSSKPRKRTSNRNLDSGGRRAVTRAAEGLLRRVRADDGPDIPNFRLAAARSVLENALDEIDSLLSPGPYNRDLSLDLAFIARTQHLFATASAVYATSVDTVSTFWTSPHHRPQAESYTAAQPPNTIRVFVFSSPASAHKHRNVLKAHAERYNQFGAVLLCTASHYKQFAELLLPSPDTNPLSHDFALLLFREREPQGLYEAVLSQTTLSWRERTVDSSSCEHSLIQKFKALAKVPPGDFHDGFLRWDSTFAESPEVWKRGLEKLFLSERGQGKELQNGDVFHLVFFAVDITQRKLTDIILQEIKGKLELLRRKDGSGRLIKELWFGSRPQTMTELSVHDGRYRGVLNTKNQLVDRFPFCIIVRFSGIDDLTEYYEHETHSSVRQKIYSLCSDNAKHLYELIADRPPTHFSPSLIYQAIESAVDDRIIRADYLEHDTIDAIVRRQPTTFSLPGNT